jgi:uncharacterized LabA/DUF88 family protein
MPIRVAILIDGGYLRVLVRTAGYKYDPDYIEKVAQASINSSDEVLLRVLYYDCAPYHGTGKLPVSGGLKTFSGSDAWLYELAAKDLFAVRRGVLKFRGFKPKKVPIVPTAMTDNDFAPDFEQKGVDMRIGLDIATFCETKAVERIILISGDTDCIPAMKHARKELLWHADLKRVIPTYPTP